jgi:hypothetical protein
MAAAKHLRPVRSGEKPTAPLTIGEAAKSGDRRALLVAMRDRVAETLEAPSCPPRDLAALTRRLQDIAREIELLDQQLGGDGSVVASTDDEDFDPAAV